MYEWQNNMDSLSSASRLDAEALSPNQQSFLRGCENLQDSSHRLLTEAAIGYEEKINK